MTIEDLKQNALSSEQMDAVNSGATSAKVATWDGYAAQIAAKANATDLPYALVTPGEWEFSGLPSGTTVVVFEYEGSGNWFLSLSDGDYGFVTESDENILSAEIVTDNGITVTATRPSLPGHLLDRAGNLVVVTGTTTLTLPAANPGYLRDFLVRLTVSASSAITFSAQTGETITWDAMGDPSATFAAGTYLYRITEVARGIWHCEDMLALVGLEAALAAINGGVAS